MASLLVMGVIGGLLGATMVLAQAAVTEETSLLIAALATTGWRLEPA